MTLTMLPGVSPTLWLHHRPSPYSPQQTPLGRWHQAVIGIRTRAVTLEPRGPLGVVIVRFKPEAAHRFLGSHVGELTDAHVCLSELLVPAAAAMRESLKEAAGPCERVARVQAFLLQHLRNGIQDRLVHHAVLALLETPSTPIRRLADQLLIGQKQLSRRFHALTGVNLKQFARIARLGKAIQTHWRGCNWTESAHSAGFSEQSHLGHEFKRMTGHSPGSLFHAASCPEHRPLNALLAASGFFDTLIVQRRNPRRALQWSRRAAAGAAERSRP
jgi:AraC-like DNA-binding protein